MVRVTAVHVLKHFQNPRIQDDIIGNALKSHMISDPSPYVCFFSLSYYTNMSMLKKRKPGFFVVGKKSMC